MFSAAINKIKSFSCKFQLFFSSALFCLTSIVCFCSGISNSNTLIEKKSAEIVSFINKHSLTDYVSIQVSPVVKEDKKSMPNTYNEYFYWKYIFRNSDFGFLSTANGGKTHECYYNEINGDQNISFLCCGNNSNPNYQDYYRHEVYDIRLMFKGNNSMVGGAINFFAISQTTATKLLVKRGLEKVSDGFTVKQYETLLGTNTTLLLDGQLVEFTISNIYFEEGNFFSNVSSNFGEFAISYIYFPDYIESESTYIFNKYIYQNSHKIQRMRSFFNNDKFRFNVSGFNLNNQDTKQSISFEISEMFDEELGNDVLSIILLIIDLFFLLISLLVFWFSEKIHHLFKFIVIALSFIGVYLLLFVINFVTPIPVLFSFFSLKLFIVELVAFLVVSVAVLFKRRRRIICSKL